MDLMAGGKFSDITALVVEDEPLVRLVAADALVDAGCRRVLEAADADEAIALLQTYPEIGAVITDIDMPGSMDGLGLTKVIGERWPEMAVLLTSGRVKPTPCSLRDGVAYLGKPYLPAEIIAWLEQAV